MRQSTVLALGFVLILAGLAIAATPSKRHTKPLVAPERYVSPAGSDFGDGSVRHPWATIQHAADAVKPGETVQVAPGVYAGALKTSVSGLPAARVRFVSDQKWGAHITATGSEVTWTNKGDYVEIVGFDVSGGSYIGILNLGSNVAIIGNHVHDIRVPRCGDNGGAGIVNANYSGVDNDIVGNVVHDIGVPGTCNGVQGIYHSNLRGHIYNNIVYRVSAWGIHTWHAARNVVIANNTVFNNGAPTKGGCMGGGITVGAGDSPGGVINDYTTVANNIVYRNGCEGIRENGATGTHNQYRNNLVYGNRGSAFSLQNGLRATGTVSADPQFVNYQADGNGDYHLRPTSPAIRAGTNLGAPDFDMDGVKRPKDGACDLGSYQSASKTIS